MLADPGGRGAGSRSQAAPLRLRDGGGLGAAAKEARSTQAFGDPRLQTITMWLSAWRGQQLSML